VGIFWGASAESQGASAESSKTDETVWNRPYEEWSDEKVLKEYPFIEEGTGRRYKQVPVHAPGTRNGATGSPWRGMMPPEGKHYSELDRLARENHRLRIAIIHW
jgi:hypothetical protein